ncbi:glycosyltransferase [Butyrivibrio proteoclasticus]|uniref:glycosyltransferase n=1 Tax=Butyrivibrio proteoclasticus TaxID=43305 RepID=UPI0004795B08|nr:glycosyltransferase [Butyrivibrio proteoclasticus]
MRKDRDYILEVSWGCPTDEYPLNGLFQFDQARALHNAGKDIVFLALDLRSFRKKRKWGYDRFVKENIQVCEYNFPCGPLPPAIKYAIQDFAFKKAIVHIEKEFGIPECIHVHCCQQAISVTEYSNKRHIPYVITEHITPLDEGDGIEKRKEKALKEAKEVIAVSKALARDIENKYGAKSVVVPNIADLSEFEYAPKNKAEGNTFEFLSAASVNYGKGFDVLIKAFAKVTRSVHLTIMGDGPEMPAIRKLADDLGVTDRISFTGSYVRRDFAEKLHASDVFVLPSRSETFGIVYIEALATGTPVIATRCGGPEDFVDETNGMLVPVDDVDALADAMRRMMQDICSDRETAKLEQSECSDADAEDVCKANDDIRNNNRFSEEFMKAAASNCRERFSAETVAGKIIEAFDR